MDLAYQMELHKKGLLSRIAKGEKLPFALNEKYSEDSIGGDNFKGFMKQLKRFTLLLRKKLKDNEPISDNFDMHLSFISHFTEKAFKYYPMVLDFEDGQQLIGLARQYGDSTAQMKLNRNSEIKITKWFLNGVDITSEVFTSREIVANPSEEINAVAKIIRASSSRFKKFHLQELRDSIEKKKELLATLREELKNIPSAKKEEVAEKDTLSNAIKNEVKGDVTSKGENTNKDKSIKEDMDRFNSILELKTINDILTDEVKSSITELSRLHESNKEKYEAIYKSIQSHLAEVATKGV